MIRLMKKHDLLFILGTRPEAIKCAPAILACQGDARFRTRVLTTSQHRILQDQVLDEFGIGVDHDLDLMREKSDLNRLIGEAWRGLCQYFLSNVPDMVLVQGDTTTAFIAALAAQYHRLCVAHIEAGLRTYDKTMPFPEEINRRLIGTIADLHFAPTRHAKENLLRENVQANRIYVTGNPGIDALQAMVERLKGIRVESRFPDLDPQKRLVVATCHRRENWGEPLRRICQALKQVAAGNPGIQVMFLTHPNPQVVGAVREEMAGMTQIIPHASVSYSEMALLLKSAYLIVTDSGGIQEEAPVLGKPVLVLREKTERIEGLEGRSALIAGTDPSAISSRMEEFLNDPEYYNQYAQPSSPYGDGRAAERIRRVLANYFGLGDPPEEFRAEVVSSNDGPDCLKRV